MDAVKKMNETFLSCTLCTERFNDPCTLGCGHTFCRSCLLKYTKTKQEAIAAKSLLCPNCRQMTKVPDPSKRVEDWPKQMKPHFLIQGLLGECAAFGDTAEAAPVNETTHGSLCSPCHQTGTSVEAGCLCQDCDITLCRDCVKMHQTMPATSNHTLTEVQRETERENMIKLFCKKHNTVVEFYCKKCRKAVCSDCAIIYHGVCDSIVTVDSVLSHMKSVVHENKGNIVSAVKELITNIARQNSMLETIEVDRASVQSEIRRVSQQAREVIEQKEKRLMDELDEVTENQSRQLKGQIKSEEIDLRKYQQYSEFMDQTLRSESQMDLYNMYQMCQSGEVRCAVDRKMDESVRSPSCKIIFGDKLDFKKICENLKLGSIELLQEGPDFTKKPRLVNTVSIRTHGDQTSVSPSPVDVTVMEVANVETVVVTDFQNSCVKSFCTKGDHTNSSTLRVKHRPRTLSQLKHNQVVVSLYSHNGFLIVQVTPDLILFSTRKTRKEYLCLKALDSDRLAAGCRDLAGIDILDLSGKVLESVKLSNAVEMIQNPLYLHTTKKGHILVSDFKSECVFCLTPEGDVVFIYQTSAYSDLRGVTSTPSGDILLVDCGNNKVIQLTERGDFVRDLMIAENVLDNPNGICLHGNRLYITEFDRGFVRVYCFK